MQQPCYHVGYQCDSSGAGALLHGPDIQVPIQLATLLGHQAGLLVLRDAMPTTHTLLRPLLHLHMARVAVAHDPAAALACLQDIPPASPWNTVAHVHAASIHLHHFHDKAGYVAVYERLAQRGDVEGLRMLGEAHRAVGDEGSALRVLQAALDAEPGNVRRAVEVGRQLAEMHEYRAAADVYIRVC